MRYVSFLNRGMPGWGVQRADGGVVEAASLGDLPATLSGWVRHLAAQPDGAALQAALAGRAASAATLPAAGLAWLPVLPDAGKLVCLGVNYHDHAKEGGNTIVEYPALFLRCNTSLLAHGAPLVVPPVSSHLDYEAELAVVIGRTARRVAEADALGHVFGYACFNDATLRDYQRKTSQWTIGKNFDATGGFGPSLVTADELPPGCTGLRIESRLNGQVMQHANTSEMVFGVARTISLLSEAMTLEPGDVLVMGTPAGVGYARKPPVWMKAGDVIEIDIERVGVLRNPVR
jgi:acylpyruvate hydrolase